VTWKWSLSAFSTFRNGRAARCLAQGLGLCAVLVATSSANAEEHTHALSQYLRDEWGPSKGYAGGPVYGLTQDADGFLWIASERGLVRFDGLKFESMDLPQAVSAGGSTVVGVAATDDGAVWARFRAASLLGFRGRAVQDVVAAHALTPGTIGVMAAQPDGGILLSSYGLGVVRFKDRRFATIVQPDAMPQTLVMSVAEMGGSVWLGTRDAGLFRFDGKALARITGIVDEKINALLPGDDGALWIGTDRGILRWTTAGVEDVSLPSELTGIPALALLRDHASNIWVAAGARGVVRIDRAGVSWFRDWNPRTQGLATTLFEDRERNIWLGTSRGIERLRDGVFATYAELPGAPSSRVGPVHVDTAGRTWFGTTEGGLFWLDGETARPVHEAGLSEDVVYSLDGDRQRLWVGRRFGGLTQLRMTDAGVVARSFTVKDGLAQDGVYVVHASPDGTVWAGTLTGGVSHLVNGTFRTFTVKDGLASDTVTAIAESRDGTMWFGSPQGLSRVSRDRWRTYTVRQGLPSDQVIAVLVDRQGRVWAATAAGLAVLRPGADRFEVMAALKARVIGLAQDQLGSLWCATQDRLVRVPGWALGDAGALVPDAIREYDALDGLLTRESVERQRTLAVDAQGRVWYASTFGLAVADPSRLARLEPPGRLTIQEIAADDVVHHASEAVAFPASRRVSISFVGISLAVPERVRYRYRLDGFDPGWSRPSPERTAVYTNLEPGPYVFRVMASDSTGQWTGREQTLAFEITPMVWQTTWFRVVLFAVLASALAAVYRLRTAQLARHLNVGFEARLAERTRIAQELHDTLLQGFLSASMHLHVAASRVPADSATRGQLSYVLDLMRRVIDDGRQAIRGLRAPGSSVDDLTVALTDVARELGIAEPTECRVVVTGDPRTIHPLIRDEVYRIGREALANAIRHASARLIEVALDYRADRFILVVRDDGVGIDDDVALSGRDGHWGLAGMRERAEAVGGRLRVRSRQATGTAVELSIPAAVAFRADEAAGPPRTRRTWLARTRHLH
jgi:signal transduction histidine kinase